MFGKTGKFFVEIQPKNETNRLDITIAKMDLQMRGFFLFIVDVVVDFDDQRLCEIFVVVVIMICLINVNKGCFRS